MGRKNRRGGGGRGMAKGRIPRIGSYAISSSITDPTCFSCTTFNILAPIYKRLDHEDQSCRESDYRANWINRNHRILDLLLYERSSIICLQEFWVGNEELVNMYKKRLGDAGYINFKLARTNNRGDGILLDVKVANWMSILRIDLFLQVACEHSSLSLAILQICSKKDCQDRKKEKKVRACKETLREN